jgi:hypothetical protein
VYELGCEGPKENRKKADVVTTIMNIKVKRATNAMKDFMFMIGFVNYCQVGKPTLQVNFSFRFVIQLLIKEKMKGSYKYYYSLILLNDIDKT